MSKRTTGIGALLAGMLLAPVAAAPVYAASCVAVPSVSGGKPATAKKGVRKDEGGVTIVALVNDEPVTRFDVDQRISLMMLGASEVNQRLRAKLKSPDINQRFRAFAMKRNPRSQAEVQALQKEFVEGLRRQTLAEVRPKLRKMALRELIDERLKVQEAKRLGIKPSAADVKKIVLSIAQRNKLSEEQFGKVLAGQGTSLAAMRIKFHADIAWREVVRRRYGHQIAVGEKDIERMLAKDTSPTTAQVELRIQKISLLLSGRIDDALMARRYSEANALRRRFKGCKSMPTLAKAVPNAKFEDLGTRPASALKDPVRTLLLQAKDGEMIPALVGDGGVELFVVCSRKTVKGDDKKREAAEDQLRQSEFNLLARRHLMFLRERGECEYR